jgi:acetyltransferase-like isoleucine patch superfamily enzyme
MKRLIQNAIRGISVFLRRNELAATIHELSERGLLTMGRHTYGMPMIWSYRGSERKVVIGSFCSIAPGVQILSGGIHPTDWVASYPFRSRWGMEGAYSDGMPQSRGEVVIGSDVWLGTDAVLLSGVTIGHGSIIAARSVVTRDVPPYSVAAGCPARVLRQRFPPQVVDALLRIAWWEWDDAKIRAAVPLLSSADIEGFLKRYTLSEQGT